MRSFPQLLPPRFESALIDCGLRSALRRSMSCAKKSIRCRRSRFPHTCSRCGLPSPLPVSLRLLRGSGSHALPDAKRHWKHERARCKSERLISLTTLRRPAHELSTPLATIALAFRELERRSTSPDTHHLTEDARLIRAEVDRCRAILDQMSGRAGGAALMTRSRSFSPASSTMCVSN